MTEPLWQPTPEAIALTQSAQFRRWLAENGGPSLANYAELQRWSVADIPAFWAAVWSFCQVQGLRGSETVLRQAESMQSAQFFPDARLNFAENLLCHRGDEPAIQFWGEARVQRCLSWDQLREQVAKTQALLLAAGVGEGDCVAGFLPNVPEAVIAMLAATSLGALWTSCSPDFGTQGVLDRFGQVEPKVVFACNGYYYNDKAHSTLAKVAEFSAALPSLEALFIVEYLPAASTPLPPTLAQAKWLHEAISSLPDELELHFTPLPFDQPLYVLYSSGTTGKPKCIIHRAGGVLLKHLVEHRFHTDVRQGDVVLYFTTCGWMMWNWLVSALASKACLALYDGSPFFRQGQILFDYADAIDVSIFGTSAKYIDALNKAGLEPKNTHQLQALRVMLSTGSPLVPESFDYVYRAIKADVQLSSVSGGTDILGCFVLGSPELPVYRGELQTTALGLDVQVFNEAAEPVQGEKGELVCVQPFPSMPLGFWQDVDGSRYQNAYFSRFAGVWCHGDYVELCPSGGMVIYGRSDTTLNPGGVRIGTAEIYRQVEQVDAVLESLVIGQQWQGDVRVVLFVRLREGVPLSSDLVEQIKTLIRQNTTARHVPAKIIAVSDIPRTKSGKIVELAVRDTVHGLPVKNSEALANPEALALYRDLPALQV